MKNNLLTKRATPEQRAANELALKRLAELFPNLHHSEFGDFLISATAYPFKAVPDCVQDLEELSKLSKGDHHIAMTISALQAEIELLGSRVTELEAEVGGGPR